MCSLRVNSIRAASVSSPSGYHSPPMTFAICAIRLKSCSTAAFRSHRSGSCIPGILRRGCSVCQATITRLSGLFKVPILLWVKVPAFCLLDRYTATVDVAGTSGQQAYLDLWNGSSDSSSSTATLGTQWQTLTTTFTTGSSAGSSQFEIRVLCGNSAAESVYFRNALLVPTTSIPTYGFQAGLESGQAQLTWKNTVDSTSPGGGESDVSSALTESSATITHGGGNAIQYGGTATGGSSTHAYLEAQQQHYTEHFEPALVLGLPDDADGFGVGSELHHRPEQHLHSNRYHLHGWTTLRGSGVTDQYSNQLNPRTNATTYNQTNGTM